MNILFSFMTDLMIVYLWKKWKQTGILVWITKLDSRWEPCWCELWSLIAHITVFLSSSILWPGYCETLPSNWLWKYLYKLFVSFLFLLCLIAVFISFCQCSSWSLLKNMELRYWNRLQLGDFLTFKSGKKTANLRHLWNLYHEHYYW